MLQNKIYQNFIKKIFKTFLTILFGFSLIALTVRSVNFLDLIVDNGYPVLTYFKYSVLNIFGIVPKFIPLSFFLTLIIFIIKHSEENELVILWTAGVKKISITNLFFVISIFILFFYLIFSTFLTPYALSKARELLKKENYNSFLPTVKSQQFSDSFKGFTFFVDKKFEKNMKNIFIHDSGNNLKGLTSNSSNPNETIILAKNGSVKDRNLILFNGQIITTKKNNENEIVKFDQIKVNLDNLVTTTIKAPKIQETSTIKLASCLFNKNVNKNYCNDDFKKEIISNLNRRIVIPFYIPLLSLICSLLLIKSGNIYLNKNSVYIYSFLLLLFTELVVRYTGMYNFASYSFLFLPLFLSVTLY